MWGNVQNEMLIFFHLFRSKEVACLHHAFVHLRIPWDHLPYPGPLFLKAGNRDFDGAQLGLHVLTESTIVFILTIAGHMEFFFAVIEDIGPEDHAGSDVWIFDQVDSDGKKVLRPESTRRQQYRRPYLVRKLEYRCSLGHILRTEFRSTTGA